LTAWAHSLRGTALAVVLATAGCPAEYIYKPIDLVTKNKELGEQCAQKCGYNVVGQFTCRSDCKRDMVCEDSLCRSPCESKADCSGSCDCFPAEYNDIPGDMNPPYCRGDTICGDPNPRCDRFHPNCDQRNGPRSCYMVSPYKDECLEPGTVTHFGRCENDPDCEAGLGCQNRQCHPRCGGELACPDGLVCLEEFCLEPCALWGECRQDPTPHTAYSPVECRPTSTGIALCIRDSYYHSDRCESEFLCDDGEFCEQGFCKRLCDEAHPTCGEDGGCVVVPEAGYGTCSY
jgi:hypothetical protein